MHRHCEIIMPPTKNIEKAVKEVLAKFNEDQGDNEDGYEKYGFWDWYVIGGRWSGNKLEQSLDRAKMEAFRAELIEKGVTVSGLQWGKQELQPASQIPMVDALWRERFPESPLKTCPLFKHSGELLAGDVMKFADVPRTIEAARIIFAGEESGEGLEATYMVEDSYYNGVCWHDSKWDGTLGDALSMFEEHHKNYKAEYREQITPKADWLVVTVDYHS